MARRIVLLSGPVASGKTTLGDTLIEKHGFVRLKTRALIQGQLGTAPKRADLQRAGEALDRRTKGRWVADALAREIARLDEGAEILVDAVRLASQVEAIRAAFGARVVHIHLTAPHEILAARYGRRKSRKSEVKELASYSRVQANATERKIEHLSGLADIVIDAHRNSAADVVVRVASRLGLYGRSLERLVDVLVGGEYGSEGKGFSCSTGSSRASSTNSRSARS